MSTFINSYRFGRGWDVSTASFVQVLSVTTQETSPRGIFFKPDGLKMYIIGSAGDEVNEYDLSTAWDISTASFNQLFSVSAQDIGPHSISFKPDGLKMYVLGSFDDDINEYDLSTAWDISTASFLQLFSVATQETSPRGIYIRADGLKVYISGSAGDEVDEYDLSTAWDVTSASFVRVLSVAAQDTSPQGVFFKPDGTKMFISGIVGVDISEYDLSTPWNISTASFSQSFSVSAETPEPTDLFFREDGLKMYVVGATADEVNEYDLG